MESTATDNNLAKPVGEFFLDMPLTSAHWKAGLTLFIAFVIESWEMMILIFSSGSIGAEFDLSTAQIGSLIGALFLGMIPGAIIWGRLMGRIGRKRCMFWALSLYWIFPLLSAVSFSYEMLWAVRFLAGVVLAGPLVVAFPYLEELVPVKVRGQAAVYLSAGWPCGLLTAVGITALLSDQGWRVVMAMSAFASLWAIVIWRWLPESPYWLAGEHRTNEAKTELERLGGGAIAGEVEPPKADVPVDSSYFQIFKQPLLKITCVQTIINFCFSWGYWAMATWLPALLAKRGLSAPEGLGFVALSALFMFPGYITASYVTGKIGRKPTMLIFVFVAAVAGFGFAYSQTVTQMYAWNFALSFFSLGAWGVWNTWLGEIYSTSARGPGVSWGITAQRVANSIAPIAIGAMLASASFLQTVVFISSFLAITFVAAIFLPETEGEVLT